MKFLSRVAKIYLVLVHVNNTTIIQRTGHINLGYGKPQ